MVNIDVSHSFMTTAVNSFPAMLLIYQHR